MPGLDSLHSISAAENGITDVADVCAGLRLGCPLQALLFWFDWGDLPTALHTYN